MSIESPEERRIKLVKKLRRYFAGRAKTLGAAPSNHYVYTRDQWAERGEDFGNDADATLAVEGRLSEALGYDEKELNKLHSFLEKNGLRYEIGYHWSWHFYEDGE